MKVCKRILGRYGLLTVITILGCLAPLGMTALSSREQGVGFEDRQRQKRERLRNAELRVQNLTHGLTVVEVEKNVDQDLIRVVFRNDYSKTVTAYKVSIGSGTVATECLSEEDQTDLLPFRPGEVREETYPLQADIDARGIRVLAVVFDDRTSDGVPQYIQEIKEYRLGMKLGMERAIDRLSGVLRLPEKEMSQGIGRLKLQLPEHPAAEERALTHFVKVGLHDVSARIAGKLARNEIKLQEGSESGTSGREATTNLMNRLAASLRKL